MKQVIDLKNGTTEMVSLSALKPSPHNARTHSKRQIAQIARAMTRFGNNSVIVIDETNLILAGHGRVEAAQYLKMGSVLALRVSHLSEAEKRAYALADNKLALNAGWDRETLATEIQYPIDNEFEIELTGFETVETDLILEDAAEALGGGAPEDVQPPYAPELAVKSPGDIWQLGKHRLLCGDMREEALYPRLFEKEKAQFVFNDFPYNVPIDGHAGGLGRMVLDVGFYYRPGAFERPTFSQASCCLASSAI